MSQKPTITFAGTPYFAKEILLFLKQSDYKINAVFTKTDMIAKRGQKLVISDVKKLAQEQNLKIFQPINFKEKFLYEQEKNFSSDILITAAYGHLLPDKFLNMFKHKINIHASLLPKWRGAAPIERAILAGDKKTGICIIDMTQKLDAGRILAKKEVAITKEDNAKTLLLKLIDAGKIALNNALDAIYLNNISYQQQDEKYATYAKKITKNEGKIDFKKDSKFILRLVRAFNPAPCAFLSANNQQIKIYQANISCNNEQTTSAKIIAYDKDGMHISAKGENICISSLKMPSKNIIKGSQIKNLANKFPIGFSFDENK